RGNRTGSPRVPYRTGDRGGWGQLRRTGRPVLGVARLPGDFGGAWIRRGRHHVVVSFGTAAPRPPRRVQAHRQITLPNIPSGEIWEPPCAGLFCFTGRKPETSGCTTLPSTVRASSVPTPS